MATPDGPIARVLSIRQPWADLILRQGKDVENRTWRTSYRGPILIHAGQKVEPEACRNFGLDPDVLPVGAIVGAAELVGVVEQSASPWFTGPIGFELARPVLLGRPFRCGGRLGIFKMAVPPELAALLRAASEPA